MKKVVLFAIILATIASACKKETATTITTNDLFIIHNLDTLLPTVAAHTVGPLLGNVGGVFTSCRTSGELTDTSGLVYHYRRNWQNAVLTDSANSVSVNGHMLADNFDRVRNTLKAWLTSYDDGTVWNDATSNNWNITGLTIPSFSVDLDGSMPKFTGSLPHSISTSSDYTYNFNSSNCADADSAYIIIHTGNSYIQSPCVNAHGGTVNILASKFAAYSGHSTTPLTHLDGGVFAGMPMAIVLYSHTFRTFAGKRYAFVKQRIILNIVELI